MLANIHSIVLNIVFIILGISVASFIFNIGIGLSEYISCKGKSLKEKKGIG